MSRVAPITAEPTDYKRPNGKDPVYMGMVAQLPCAICLHFDEYQTSPTQVHHCIHGRYSGRKVPDRKTIPLCEGHHLGHFDNSKLAIHSGKETWANAYGPDTDFIAWTQDQILGSNT